jgi:hypothetical protein
MILRTTYDYVFHKENILGESKGLDDAELFWNEF